MASSDDKTERGNEHQRDVSQHHRVRYAKKRLDRVIKPPRGFLDHLARHSLHHRRLRTSPSDSWHLSAWPRTEPPPEGGGRCSTRNVIAPVPSRCDRNGRVRWTMN